MYVNIYIAQFGNRLLNMTHHGISMFYIEILVFPVWRNAHVYFLYLYMFLIISKLIFAILILQFKFQ